MNNKEKTSSKEIWQEKNERDKITLAIFLKCRDAMLYTKDELVQDMVFSVLLHVLVNQYQSVFIDRDFEECL